MKKLNGFFAALIVACALTFGFAFAGCATDGRGDQPDGTIADGHSIAYAFTVSESLITVDGGSMLDYMNALKRKGELVFEGEDGSYGFYITSVMGIGSVAVSSTANSYSGWDWAVYTTVTTIDGTTYSDDKTAFVYNGVTLYKASYGVSGVPCIAGQSYALVYEFSSMTW